MNNKIIALAKQAGFVFLEDESWGPGSEYIDWASDYDKELEKLVDLVVQDCAKSVQHIKAWDSDLGELVIEKFYGK